MDERTWTTVDKTGWKPGPWKTEVDKLQWPDPATGLPCLIRRAGLGHLCGYVGVPPGHPFYGVAWEDLPELSPDVNYAAACQEGPEGETICHVPGPGEPDHLWWLGFDCGHAWDIQPNRPRLTLDGYDDVNERLNEHIIAGGGAYRTVEVVRAIVTILAAQVAALSAAT